MRWIKAKGKLGECEILLQEGKRDQLCQVLLMGQVKTGTGY